MKQITKNITTVERLLQNKLNFDFNRINMLYGKVVSVAGRNLPENISMLLQCCGNLGSIIYREVSKSTNIVIIESLESISDRDVIDAPNTAGLFTIEEITKYVEKRVEMFPDESTEFYLKLFRGK